MKSLEQEIADEKAAWGAPPEPAADEAGQLCSRVGSPDIAEEPELEVALICSHCEGYTSFPTVGELKAHIELVHPEVWQEHSHQWVTDPEPTNEPIIKTRA